MISILIQEIKCMNSIPFNPATEKIPIESLKISVCDGIIIIFLVYYDEKGVN